MNANTKQIRYFLIRPIESTPFAWEDAKERFEKKGIRETKSIEDADVVICPTLNRLIANSLKYGKKKSYLAAAYETRYVQNPTPLKKLLFGRVKIHLMTPFTDDIFFNEAHFFGMNGINPGTVLENIAAEDVTGFENKKICTILRYTQPGSTPCKLNGVDFDLNRTRMTWAIEGAKLNKIDVIGKDFPDNLAVGFSDVYSNEHSGIPENYTGPMNEWHTIKLHVLQKYHFNLCMENTDLGNYITEKIWHSIQGGCLPIYYSDNNRLKDYFPANSFINAVEFKNVSELLEYTDKMTIQEYVERLNNCIDYFNVVSQREALTNNTRLKHIDNVAAKIIFAHQNR